MLNWKKRGKIFDPSDFELPGSCASFAQGPQVLVLDDSIRVFFSTRERDRRNKYLSRVSYVDFSLDFETILDVSKNEVVPLGDIGCFDEHGIFPFHVARIGNRVLAYTTGWNRRVSVSNDAAVGLAISIDNGQTFEKHGNGPLLSPTLQEPFLIADSFVLPINGTLHMWYIYGSEWVAHENITQPERVYKITHATSQDGFHWTRDASPMISDKIDNHECQAMPTVFTSDGLFHMIFCYRAAFGFRDSKEASYKLGYAWSRDAVEWTRDDDLLGLQFLTEDWDSEMQCYPHIFTVNGEHHLLYNGNDFGRTGFGLATLVSTGAFTDSEKGFGE